jgi:hypothetical protein
VRKNARPALSGGFFFVSGEPRDGPAQAGDRAESAAVGKIGVARDRGRVRIEKLVGIGIGIERQRGRVERRGHGGLLASGRDDAHPLAMTVPDAARDLPASYPRAASRNNSD